MTFCLNCDLFDFCDVFDYLMVGGKYHGNH